MASLQLKALYLNLKDPIFITNFLANITLSCDANHMHYEAAIWALSRFVNEMPAYAIKSCMYLKASLTPLAASVRGQKLHYKNCFDDIQK